MRIARPDLVRLGANAHAFEPSSAGSTRWTRGDPSEGPSPSGASAGAAACPGRARRREGSTRARNCRAWAGLARLTSRAATSYPVNRGAKPAGNSSGCSSTYRFTPAANPSSSYTSRVSRSSSGYVSTARA
jgi:hypothetical protein